MKWFWYLCIACIAYIVEFIILESYGVPLLILYPILTTLVGRWEDSLFVTFISGLLYASMTFVSLFVILFALLVLVIGTFLVKRYLFSHFSLITIGLTTYGALLLFYATTLSISDLLYRVGITEITLVFTQELFNQIITINLIATILGMIAFAIIAKFTKILNTAFITQRS